jgi:hypothetical protein
MSPTRGIGVGIMIEGSFESFSAAELLYVLAAFNRTGHLWLECTKIPAELWLRDGRCEALNPPPNPPPTRDAFVALLTDICAAVIHADDGRFRFSPASAPPWRVPEPVAIQDVLHDIERALRWRDMCQSLTLDSVPHLNDCIDSDASLTPQQWRTITAIDGRRPIREIATRLHTEDDDLADALEILARAGIITFTTTARDEPPLGRNEPISTAETTDPTAAEPLPHRHQPSTPPPETQPDHIIGRSASAHNDPRPDAQDRPDRQLLLKTLSDLVTDTTH